MNPQISNQFHKNLGPKLLQTYFDCMDTTDLLQLYYLLVEDYNSKLVAFKDLKNSQSLTTINKFKKIFSQYGIPEELITDNGREFTCHHFKKFSELGF